jgi:hypothetical protein
MLKEEDQTQDQRQSGRQSGKPMVEQIRTETIHRFLSLGK